MNDKNNLTNIVEKLGYIKPPPPPIKMQVEDYIELLSVMKSNPQVQQEVLEMLEAFHTEVQILADKLSDDLRKKYLNK
jgi:hypothetical protein